MERYLGVGVIARHTPPQLVRVEITNQDIRRALTKYHTLEAAVAQDVSDGGSVRITINDKPCTFTDTVVEGWHLVESADHDTHLRPKVFYLLPVSAHGLRDHHGSVPYMEYAGSDFDERYAGPRARRGIHLYTTLLLASQIKDPHPSRLGDIGG